MHPLIQECQDLLQAEKVVPLPATRPSKESLVIAANHAHWNGFGEDNGCLEDLNLGANLPVCMAEFEGLIDQELAALDVIELELLAAQYDLPVDDDEDGNEDFDEDYDDNDDDANYELDKEEAKKLLARCRDPMFWDSDKEEDKASDADHNEIAAALALRPAAEDDEATTLALRPAADDDEATLALMPAAAEDDEATLALMPASQDDEATISSFGVVVAASTPPRTFRQSTLDLSFRKNNVRAHEKQKTRS